MVALIFLTFFRFFDIIKRKEVNMIRAEIFDQHGQTYDFQNFIKENKITREQIISINFAIDSEAHRRYSTQQILLVWEEEK